MFKNRVLLILLFMGGLCFLWGTQPFWSLEPSTQEIARADSSTGFVISQYSVNLEINDQTHWIQGYVVASVYAQQALSGIDYELEGDSLSVTQVMVNGNPSPFTHLDGIIHIPLSVSIGMFDTVVYYEGVPQRSPAPYNIGLIFSPNFVYTLSNPDAGRYWWPSYDHPWKKARVNWSITVRDDWLVAANGIRTGIVDNGNGTRTHHWTCNSNVATYVMGFAAGPYTEFLQASGDIPIQNFVTPGQLSNAQIDFANVPEMISYFSTIYGPYPFQKYGHVVVPMTTYAAMEHQTMTTFGAAYLSGNQNYESIVAHELTHQWYGNYLTPITMREVWLKESFATYGEFLWESHHEGWQAGCDYLRDQIQQYYITWENSNGPHTIFNPEYNLMFAPPTYEKSASVLHMLRLKIGNAQFFEFISAILLSFPGGNINTGELIALAEQISGQDLSQFFQQWIYSPGIPNASFTILHNNNGLARVIGTSISPTATLFDLDVPLYLPGSALADSVLVRATAGGFESSFAYDLNSNLAGIQIDPNHWVLARQLTQNNMHLSTCLAYNGAVDLSWIPFDGGIPLSGYHVYRRSLPAGDFIRITPNPLTGLAFTDHEVNNNQSYQYYVVAVDTQDFETLPSNMMDATPIDFPFDLGFLVVDETRNGNGANISPTDQTVDDYYDSVLGSFTHSQWDYDLQGAPPLATLSHYPLVLWHCDDFSDMQLIHNLNALGSYVLSGGKLIISGWKFPSQFDSAFMNKFLPGISLALNNSAVLVSAQGSNDWPDLHPDPGKLATVWNGMLPMSYVFSGATNVIQTAQILNGGTNNGQPLAIRLDHTGTLVLLGFPLYFMQQSEVQVFLQQLIPELCPGMANNDALTPELVLSLSCQPNPFSASTRIAIQTPRSSSALSLGIYNLRGQKVRDYELSASGQGTRYLLWDGCDMAGRRVGTGVYILELRGRDIHKTLKILRLN